LSRQQKVNIAELAEKYGRQVFHSAYRVLSDTYLAEDVTQEVFLKLFKKSAESFDHVKHWPGYLKNMAISAAIDQLRRNKRLAEDSIERMSEQADNRINQPLQNVLTQRDLYRFRAALANLATQDAQVFCLRHVEGYSYLEIADLVGISTSLVGVTIHRAQRKLLSQLGESQLLGENNES
jgi:RNA polymerase sigma-70 factor (ECF subfamily)